MIKTRGSD